jgi:DNA-binding CsgD family transcriptional regulator
MCAAGHRIEGDNLREVVTASGEVRRYCRRCDNDRSATRQRDARAARGLLKTRLSPVEKDRIRELSGDGMSQRKIAKELGRSLMAVQNALKGDRP